MREQSYHTKDRLADEQIRLCHLLKVLTSRDLAAVRILATRTSKVLLELCKERSPWNSAPQGLACEDQNIHFSFLELRAHNLQTITFKKQPSLLA